MSAAVVWLPLVGWAPVHPPEPVQAVAFVEVHVRVLVAPTATDCGLANRVTVGAGTTATVTAAGVLAPPGPVQVREYEVLVVSAAVVWLPLVGWAPVHPPEPVQAVAFVEVHVSVLVAPTATDCGLAIKLTVAGGTTAATATVTAAGVLAPPGPVQVREYEVLVVSAAVVWLPLVGWVPVHPPEAAQDVAFVEVHVSVLLAPAATDCGLAIKVTMAAGATTIVTAAGMLVPPGPLQVSE